MPKLNQSGISQVLVLVAVLGLLAFLVLATSADFKDKLFGRLYQKPASKAAEPTVERPGDIAGCKVTAKKVTPVRTSDCSKGLYKNISFTCSDNYKYKSLPDNYINGCIGTGDLKKEAEEICNTRSRCEGGTQSPNPNTPQSIQGDLYKPGQQTACAVESPKNSPVGTYKLSYIETLNHSNDKVRIEIDAASVDDRGKPVIMSTGYWMYYGVCSNNKYFATGKDKVINKNGRITINQEIPLSNLTVKNGEEPIYSIQIDVSRKLGASPGTDSIVSQLFNLKPFFDYNQKVTANP